VEVDFHFFGHCSNGDWFALPKALCDISLHHEYLMLSFRIIYLLLFFLVMLKSLSYSHLLRNRDFDVSCTRISGQQRLYCKVFYHDFYAACSWLVTMFFTQLQSTCCAVSLLISVWLLQNASTVITCSCSGTLRFAVSPRLLNGQLVLKGEVTYTR
jgi:hypothetical protein